jgi:hypothetical protein
MDHELEFVMTDHDEKQAAFEWVVPEGASEVRHLSVGGNYVGSIAPDIVNPAARHQWIWGSVANFFSVEFNSQ